MSFKTLRIAALAAAFLGSAVAVQAAENMTPADTGGATQKAGKQSQMMNHKKPKKGSMKHDSMSHDGMKKDGMMKDDSKGKM